MNSPDKSDHLSHGKLAPCPNTPNCVSSEATQEGTHVEPLDFGEPVGTVWQALQDVIIDMGGRIEQVDKHLLHATFRSRFCRFIDDVTCRVDEENNLIHIRSAARLGYFDFGVNRKRVEQLREQLRLMIKNKESSST